MYQYHLCDCQYDTKGGLERPYQCTTCMESHYIGLLVLTYHMFIFPLQPLKLTTYSTYIDYLET